MGIVVFRHLNPARVFFLLWPHFARAPRHWFLENFLLSAPGVQSFFFFVALRWAPATFRRGQSKKKNITQGVFFCSGPGERQGKEKPRAGTGPEQKKNTTQGVFFCCGPGERQGKEKPRWAPARGQSKKKTPPRVFFFSGPRGKAGEGEAPLGAGTAPKPQTLNQLIVEARKLEHNCPHTLKVEYRGSQH